MLKFKTKLHGRLLMSAVLFIYAALGIGQDSNKFREIITYSNDTVYGKVKSRFVNNDSLLIFDRPLAADTVIAIKSIRYYNYKQNKYEYLYRLNKSTGVRKYFSCKVLLDGKAKLLANYSGNRVLYYVFVEGKYYAVSRRHFSNTVWEKLCLCSLFKSKFDSYYLHHHKKIVLMPKHVSYWSYMLNYYNDNCENK